MEYVRTAVANAFGAPVFRVTETDTTMEDAKILAARGEADGTAVFADFQRRGRGRIEGRSWESRIGDNLLCTVILRRKAAPGFTLQVGLAVARTFDSFLSEGDVTAIKWPNDVLHDGAKLGGILVELQSQTQNDPGSALAVIGIGVNLTLPDGEVERDGVALPVAALANALAELPDRHLLFARLLIELAQVFDDFSAGGFTVLREQWQSRHAWQDRPVRLLRDGRVVQQGICRGADDDGALLVQTATGLERCLSGDLTLRAL